MAQKIPASMPEGLDLAANYSVEWVALDPSTGDPATGVVVSEATMIVTQVSPGTADDLAFGPFAPMFVPVSFDTPAADAPSGPAG